MPFRTRDALIVAALAAAALLYLWLEERDFAVDLLKALFGLSGGTTAGG
ncbi:hypothetical protein [Methylocystis bryophila]|nr:hypothetical protein [Methylocystis bryophila]BDV38935.1 hypothetical protein DSM21852_21880 [Methylocystis bryophila]